MVPKVFKPLKFYCILSHIVTYGQFFFIRILLQMNYTLALKKEGVGERILGLYWFMVENILLYHWIENQQSPTCSSMNLFIILSTDNDILNKNSIVFFTLFSEL